MLMVPPTGGDTFVGVSGVTYTSTSAQTNVGPADVRQALQRNWVEIFSSLIATAVSSVVTRPPGVNDNTTLGYTTSSLWQYQGKVYNASAYCGSDSAAWQPEYRALSGGPVDVMGTTATKFAGGTCAMLKGFTGPALDVAVIVAGVYQISTINILANGEIDTVTLGAVMAQADANTNCKVLKIYDQSGNGNHATLANAAGVPVVVNATVTTSTTFTVNSTTSGTVVIGQQVFGNSIPPGITIASGTGPYTLSAAAALNPAAQTVYLATTSPPYIDYDPTFGRYLIYSPNEITLASTTNRRGLQLPQTATFTSAQNIGVFAVGMGISSADAACPQLCALGDSTVAAGNTAIVQGSGGSPANAWGQLCLFSSSSKIMTLSITNQPMVLTISTTGSAVTGYVNEKTANGSAPAAQALSGGWVNTGGSGQASYSMMKIAGIAFFNSAPTSAQNSAMRKAAYSRYNIYPQVLNQLVTIGDSRFTSTFVTPQFGNGDMLGKLIGRNWNIFNVAQSGTTTLTQIGDALVPTVTGVAKSLQTLKGPGLNYAVICVGVNDFIVNSASPQTVLGYLQTYCAQIAAAGWTPILIAELATSNSTGSANTNIPILHSLVMAAGASGMNASALIDLSGYVPVMTPATTAYYYDGLHPTLATHQIIASAIAAALPSV